MSYIDDLNDAAARAQVAANTAEDATQILFDVANGDSVSTVTTASGEVKTVAKAIADIESQFEDSLFETTTEQVVLTEGQTSVTLTEATTDSMQLYVEGAREFSFTITGSDSFEISEGFPAGTRLWVVSGEIVSESSVVEEVNEAADRAESAADSVLSAGVWVSVKADASALLSGDVTNGAEVTIKEGAERGVFIKLSGDYSQEVSSDAGSGVYIAFSDDPTGSSSVLFRQDSLKEIRPDWWGVSSSLPAAENYSRLSLMAGYLETLSHIPVIKMPDKGFTYSTTIAEDEKKTMATISNVPSFHIEYGSGDVIDSTDYSVSGAELTLFVTTDVESVAVSGMKHVSTIPTYDKPTRGLTVVRPYRARVAKIDGRATGLLAPMEPRQCDFVSIEGDYDACRYPSLVFNAKHLTVNTNTNNCWRDFFTQGAESGQIRVNSTAPNQHSMLKSYDSTQITSDLTVVYKARGRTYYDAGERTGQVAIEIQSDEQAIFRNIHFDLDIEGNYERPLMIRKYDRNGDADSSAKGHVLQNITFSGRYRNTSGNTGNLFLFSGVFPAGDNIQNMALDGLSVVGSFVFNVSPMIDAISPTNKLVLRDATFSDLTLESHENGFYREKIVCDNVTIANGASTRSGRDDFGVMRFTRSYSGDFSSGINILRIEKTRSINGIRIEYTITATESQFSTSIRGTLDALVAYPTSGVPYIGQTDQQHVSNGTAGTVTLVDVSGEDYMAIQIPEWTSFTSALGKFSVTVEYSSYDEGDYSSLPGMVYDSYSPA